MASPMSSKIASLHLAKKPIQAGNFLSIPDGVEKLVDFHGVFVMILLVESDRFPTERDKFAISSVCLPGYSV